MVKVFVTVDIEGVAGVVHSEEGSKGNPEYERARRLMTAEASAVVAGIFDAEPNAEVSVVDAHGPYRNIVPDDLDERATLSRGKPRHFGMMDGIEGGYDAAMFVGVHGRAGAGTSVLSHTFTGMILDVRINDISYGELGLNAAMAGAFDVPVILVSGDQVVHEEARELLGDGVIVVPVKHSRAHMAAESVHPKVACRRLHDAAKQAIRERHAIQPLHVETPVNVEVTLARPVYADLVGMLDDVERVNGRTLRLQRADMLAVYRILRLITVLCSTPI